MNVGFVFRLVASLLATLLLTQAAAQGRQRIEKAEDLPRFSYPVQGQLDALVRDDAKFKTFADLVRHDVESVLAKYDIAERATQRQMTGLLVTIAVLDGRYDDAVRLAEQLRALQDRPADRMLAGLQARAMAAAARRAPDRKSEPFLVEVRRAVRAELDGYPFAVIQDDIKRYRTFAELASEARSLGRLREELQPVADRAGALSSDLAPAVIFARYAIEVLLPARAQLVEAYAGYLSANRVDKPDIWVARNVALPAGAAYAPVRVAVWDSGIDTSLFADRLIIEQGRAAFIGFDRYNRPTFDELRPLPAQTRARRDVIYARSKGIADSLNGVDSPQAAEVKRFMSGLSADQYKAVQEELTLMGEYMHGTHVAGIALSGNPYARVASVRIEWSATLKPDPCPTRDWAERAVAAYAADVAFMQRLGIRVVNMSWTEQVPEIENALELCGTVGDTLARKALAREYHKLMSDGFVKAVTGAPEILFVAAAGNGADDPTFHSVFPSGVVLPHLVTVGAVDKAGEEASFTSYGPTVVLHANGSLVESPVPGGTILALSGTSMAAPQVTNLAAKMLAVKPALKPTEIIAIMRSTAEKSADGRRTLINPAKALAAVGYTP